MRLGDLFTRGSPVLAEAQPRDAAAIAALHAGAFSRGWSEHEVEALLLAHNVVAHRASAGRALAGFIMSRIAADEAEILSVASSPAWRGRGVARSLLGLHLRRLAGLSVRAVFLEVAENNTPAQRLYARSGFRELSRRENYYRQDGGQASAALILRRDLP